MSLRVRPTSLAAEQIRSESRWWRRNRLSAPTLFRDEIRRAFDLIAEHPEIGAVAEDTEIEGVRRVLLAATHHYLYYSVDETVGTIQILAVWSTSREEGPHL
ncbi:MAG: type II toxin-antitoxin system RelE/ParE family toxin [Thermoanaerobaculia bacterium]